MVMDRRPVRGEADRETCLPCGCVIPVRHILRVRDYAALAMAHRDAAGKRPTRGRTRSHR
jgi:hypothetical protein